MKNKKFFIHITLLCLVFTPIFLFAQGTPCQPGKICNPFAGGDDFMSLLTAILNNVVLPIAAVFVVIFIIYAGFKYVTAQGNPAEIKKAHERLLWSLIGAGILLGASAISQVVQHTVCGFVTC
jgi:type IV secretory pathway VirB2 component (pilin)